jgi:hypothetical protein
MEGPPSKKVNRIKNPKEQKMSYAKKTEQGDILLTPGEFAGSKNGPSGLPITSVNLSRMGCTILWFITILTEKEDVSSEWKISDRVYRASRTPDGISLEDIRGGSRASVVKFSLREISNVLSEIQQIMAEESAKDA